MTAAAVYALALLPAVIWGFTPILSKRGMAGGGSSLQASLVVVAVDTTLYVLVLLATRGTEIFVDLPFEAIALFVLAGVVGTALGRLAIFTGVDRVGAAINTAAVSIRPLFATVLAFLLLGESVGLHTAIGILVVVTGLITLTLSKGGDVTGWARADLRYPLLAALFFATGNVARRYGLVTFPDVSLLEAVIMNEFGGMVALGTFALVAGRRDVLHAPRKTYAYFAGSGTLTAVALLSLFAALQAAQVAIVDPLSATAPLFTTVFAAVLLRDLEQVTRQVVAGAVLIVLGVVVITAF
ncbi:MAG: EamA family transporter [Halobacteriota archaeon]